MRLFSEVDPLNLDCPEDSGSRLIYKNIDTVRSVMRDPPIKISNPFSPEFFDDFSKPQRVQIEADFCAEAVEAVIFGERAVITRDNRLTTDCSNTPQGRVTFTEETRRFEFMSDVLDHGGELSSLKVDNPDIFLDGEYCLLSSWEHYNYGAVLLREIPKIITLRKLGLTNLKILSPTSKWHLDLLETFGIRNIQDHDRTKSYSCTKLLVPSQKAHNLFCDRETRELFSSVGDQANLVGGEFGPAIYVSRTKQAKSRPGYRECMNEEELVYELSKRGLQILCPEDLSVRNQIRAFRSASLVVGPSGSGMFNTAFCQPGTHVISLESQINWVWQHCNLFSSLGLSYELVTGGSASHSPEVVHQPWLADVRTIMTRVDRALNKLRLG